MNIGLKLWSTNDYYLDTAKLLYDESFFDYIELYIVPGSYESYKNKWKELGIPIEIHGPHIKSNFNLSDARKRKSNSDMMQETKLFADYLKSSYIVYHPGINGNIEESIYQIKVNYDDRIVIENMPYIAIDGCSTCLGSTPDEISYIIDECKVDFCLDIGHAIYSANYRNKNPLSIIDQFQKKSPRVVHIMDGNYKGIVDEHLNFNHGSFPVKQIINNLLDVEKFTFETNKKSNDNLDDFKNDVIYLRDILSE